MAQKSIRSYRNEKPKANEQSSATLSERKKRTKAKKSFFGATRGIGPFTAEDEMKDHD